MNQFTTLNNKSMHDLDKVNLALDQIQKAEQTRVLWQLLMKTLELRDGTAIREVVEAINTIAKLEDAAIKIIADTQRTMKNNIEEQKTEKAEKYREFKESID